MVRRHGKRAPCGGATLTTRIPNSSAYLARGRSYRTAYLSLTRGDGGQNVIGPEIFEELGVIRTQELLAARRLDGGRQFFSRAVDFGFSRTPTRRCGSGIAGGRI